MPTASGRLPVLPSFRAQKTTSSPFDRFKVIPNLLKLLHLERGKQTVIHEAGAEVGEVENMDWLIEFADRVKSVGDTLGFGHCEKWTIETERYQVVRLWHDESFIALLRRKDASQDDLEAAANAVAEGD